MKLTSDNETLAENKVLILYILNKVNEPISNDALFKLVLAIEEMNYFYFQQFLLDLSENKYIVSYTHEHETLYEITESGKNTLSLTIDILPGIKKLKIDCSFKNELDNIKDEVAITTEFEPAQKNGFIIHCKIIENNETIFQVSTHTGSREQAKNIENNWKKNASFIYPEILKLINNPI